MPNTRHSNRSRAWRVVIAVAGAALLVTGLVAATTGQQARADSLHDFPLEITYELTYQQTPDRSQPLATAKAVWVVTSLSDWEFTFLSGPDVGTVYRLEPGGTFTSSDGRTSSSTEHEPGVEMVPLPDMALDSQALITTSDASSPASVSVDRGSARSSEALRRAASVSGFTEGDLAGATLTRESSVDAFEYNADTDNWIGIPGTVEETLVVDLSAPGIMFREIVFDGQLIRRVAVVDVTPLDP